MTPEQKEGRLRDLIRGYGSIAVAYSGGVDSAYLAAVAHEVLGGQATMILADSPSIPRAEVRDAVELARTRGWKLELIQTREFENDDYLKNSGDRCYFCKSALFLEMHRYASAHGVSVLAYGAMADDRNEERPGHKAAREYRVVAPLQDVAMGKDEIRAQSRGMGLPTAEKASFACLASRFPTGTRITREEIQRVETAEDVLRLHGFRQYRTRHHGEICRIEIDPADFAKLLDAATREDIVTRIRALGYRHVALDLSGYRMGSVAATPP